MASIALHPSELACAFAFGRVTEIVGWGAEPFQPQGEATGDWLAQGQERLVAAGRMTAKPGGGTTLTDAMTAAVMALIDPGMVLLAQARVGEGMKRMTVHVLGADLVGLIHRQDGLFEMSRYADLTVAAVACARFAGATLEPVERPVRVDTSQKTLAEARRLARAGKLADAAPLLAGRGATTPDARAALQVLAAPAASGVVSVLYCRDGAVVAADTQSVLTGAAGDSWVVVPVGGPDGPAIVERSSVAALAARVAVGVAARMAASA
jgi:hypothetical protein